MLSPLLPLITVITSRTNKYQVIVTNGAPTLAQLYVPTGNLTNVVTASYTNSYEWDAADRLVAINAATNRSEFTYDGLSQSEDIGETEWGGSEHEYFVWCGTELCEQRSFTNGQ